MHAFLSAAAKHRTHKAVVVCMGRQTLLAMPQQQASSLQKVAIDFIARLEERVPPFLEAVENKLPIVQQYHADHVCWRTETMPEYEELVQALQAFSGARLLIESIVGGHLIATFKLQRGIPCQRRNITILEIPSPKEGSPYATGLEHVEFVIGMEDEKITTPINNDTHQSTLDAFMESHKDLPWNTKAKQKRINPDVSFKLEVEDFGICLVKFHLLALEKVIEYEIAHEG